MIATLIQQLEKEIALNFESDFSGHDIYHLRRVANMALDIQRTEGGDSVVIAAAAMLHDIHRLIEYETKHFCAPKDSLPIVNNILDRISFPEDQRGQVLYCVEFHEEYNFSEKGNPIKDIETLILQDADNLDAMGAVGIGRTFAFAGAHEISMWLPDQPFAREHYTESERDPSVLHHFHSKLLKLKDNMNTKTAREIAEKRHQFMAQFVRKFIAEWNGEA